MPSIDLSKSIRKSCSVEEAAPKRKHVRACIVYTWDHHSAAEFFIQMKSQPLGIDDVQLFKSLILLHKVIQEGHPSALKEAIKSREWVRSLGRVHGSGSGYGSLIKEYVEYLCLKLDFHAQHRGFQSGTFEYKEYISLMHISDPDEGYETILDLMDLQDAVDRFQMVILASIGRNHNSECRVAALVPLVSESYGIYKFVNSMLRALTEQLGETTALDSLIERYDTQHNRLFEFYADCSSIKYLTSLITLPKLPASAPTFDMEPRRTPSPEPSVRPQSTLSRKSSSALSVPPPAPRSRSASRPPPASEMIEEERYVPDFSTSEAVEEPVVSSDVRLTIYLSRQTISHYNEPVSVLSICQLCNDVTTQFLTQAPHIPSIIQLTHQITTLLQHNPSPLLAQASQLYFQALLSPSQQDIINANTNLQQLLTN